MIPGRFFSEPYRLFFPAAVFAGICGVSHWLLYGTGLISSYSGRLHSSLQMQGYMPSFVFGFLLTAFPRFTASRPACGKEIFPILFFLAAVTVFHSLSLVFAALCSYAAAILLVIRFTALRAGKRTGSQIQPPLELVWILAALFTALSGVFLSAAGELDFVSAEAAAAGKLMLDQGFILFIVLGAGGFLGPRIMGVFRPDFHPAHIRTAAKETLRRRLMTGLYLVCAGLLFLSFFIEASGHIRTGYFIRASVVSFVLLKTKALCLRPLNRDPFVKLLWVSFWMLFAGHWAAALAPLHRTALLHIVFLGGYSLMTFAVGTMVVLSHAGETSRLKRWSWALAIVILGLSFALSLRLASTYFPEQYFVLLAAAASCWLFSAAGWLVYILPRAVRFPGPAEAEKRHEEAKKSILEKREKEKLKD